MRVQLAFGKGGLSLELPEGRDWRVVEPRWAEPVADPAAAIERALDSPVAGPALEELARSVGVSARHRARRA